MLRNPEKFAHKDGFVLHRQHTIYFAFLYSSCTVKSLAEYLKTTEIEILENDTLSDNDINFPKIQNEYIKQLKHKEIYDITTGLLYPDSKLFRSALCISPRLK